MCKVGYFTKIGIKKHISQNLLLWYLQMCCYGIWQMCCYGIWQMCCYFISKFVAMVSGKCVAMVSPNVLLWYLANVLLWYLANVLLWYLANVLLWYLQMCSYVNFKCVAVLTYCYKRQNLVNYILSIYELLRSYRYPAI